MHFQHTHRFINVGRITTYITVEEKLLEYKNKCNASYKAN